MSDELLLKCTKDTVGYWTEGETYPAKVVSGLFVVVGDDDDDTSDGGGWIANQKEHMEDGSIIYQIGGIDGEVLFEGAAQ